jgi:hypothetical protein
VLACVPGERHTLGPIAFGLALRDLAWRVTYLSRDAALGGAALAGARAEWALAHALPADPLVAAHALTDQTAARATGDLPGRPVSVP